MQSTAGSHRSPRTENSATGQRMGPPATFFPNLHRKAQKLIGNGIEGKTGRFPVEIGEKGAALCAVPCGDKGKESVEIGEKPRLRARLADSNPTSESGINRGRNRYRIGPRSRSRYRPRRRLKCKVKDSFYPRTDRMRASPFSMVGMDGA